MDREYVIFWVFLQHNYGEYQAVISVKIQRKGYIL
jgi:hypothetical protein